MVSEAQRSMAHALAAGAKPKKKTGMTQAVARKLIAHDEGGKLPKRAPKPKGQK